MILLGELPLGDETKGALRDWNAAYDGLDGRAHHAEGRRLEGIVQEELGPGWQVRYRP